jgi:hypothetical protein
MSYFKVPFYDAIAQKQYSNIVRWEKLGFNPEVKNVDEDMWTYGGVYTFPAAATKMDIVSSDDKDGKTSSPNSVGARTVTIYGLGATYNELSETITLDGVTPVETTNSYLRINNMRVATVGSENDPAGNLTLSEKDGTTYRYGYIRAGFTRQRNMIYTVPLGKTLYITSALYSAVTGAVGHWTRFTLLATYDDKSDTTLPAGFYMPYTELSIVETSFTRDYMIPLRLPATTDLRVRVVCDGTVTMLCQCVLRGYVVS